MFKKIYTCQKRVLITQEQDASKGKHMSIQKHVHKCSQSIIHNSQKGETPKCPSTDEWINNGTEYFSTIRKRMKYLHILQQR